MRRRARSITLLGPLLGPILVVASCAGPAEPPAEPVATAPSPAVELPAVDTAAMEPQVAAKIEAARAAVAAAPERAEAWGRLGQVYQAHALYPAAVACYREAIARAPREARWPYLAALAQQKIALEEAREYFAAAARLEPEGAAFYVNYGNLLLQLGEPEQARARYRLALTKDPSSSHARYGLAQVALATGDDGGDGNGDDDGALEHLERAARDAPHHGEVQALLAQLYHRRGEAEAAALAELRARAHADASRPADPVVAAMEAEAVNSRAHTQRGMRLAREGRFAEAEAAFRRVLEIRPGNARDHANLGAALARQGRLEEAMAAYREARRLEPEDPYSRNNLGLALADRGDLEAAAAELEAAIALDPAYAEAHDNLGLVRYRQGRFDDAARHHRAAIEAAPWSAESHAQLGAAQAGGGDLDGAVASWRRALELDPHHISALYNLSVAEVQRGDHAAAIATLRRGLEIAPNSSRLVFLLAWELATAPDPELRDGAEARRLAERLYGAYPERPDASDLMAAALAESGDFAAAIEAAQRAAALARRAGQRDLAGEIEARLAGYRARRPFRQPAP